jgi:hypothetical protein
MQATTVGLSGSERTESRGHIHDRPATSNGQSDTRLSQSDGRQTKSLTACQPTTDFTAGMTSQTMPETLQRAGIHIDTAPSVT